MFRGKLTCHWNSICEMLDELIDQAWKCFNKMDKKPPDRTVDSSSIMADTLKRSSSISGQLILDPSVLPDRQKLDSDFKQLLVSYLFPQLNIFI